MFFLLTLTTSVSFHNNVSTIKPPLFFPSLLCLTAIAPSHSYFSRIYFSSKGTLHLQPCSYLNVPTNYTPSLCPGPPFCILMDSQTTFSLPESARTRMARHYSHYSNTTNTNYILPSLYQDPQTCHHSTNSPYRRHSLPLAVPVAIATV